MLSDLSVVSTAGVCVAAVATVVISICISSTYANEASTITIELFLALCLPSSRSMCDITPISKTKIFKTFVINRRWKRCCQERARGSGSDCALACSLLMYCFVGGSKYSCYVHSLHCLCACDLTSAI
jgi:hypothetical protein